MVPQLNKLAVSFDEHAQDGRGVKRAAPRDSEFLTDSAARSRALCASRRRRKQSGLTLVELIVAFSILLILSTMAVPLARYQVRRQREKDLLTALHDMHTAIDKYKDMCDAGKIAQGDPETYCYPKSLTALVEGVALQNTISGNSQSGKYKFLRRIPVDPFTNSTDWGIRSMQDEPTSTSWGGQNVFDVYSKTNDKASDGKAYSEW